jgi:hypothetical protein
MASPSPELLPTRRTGIEVRIAFLTAVVLAPVAMTYFPKWWLGLGLLVFYFASGFLLESRLILCTLLGILAGMFWPQDAIGNGVTEHKHFYGQLIMGTCLGVSLGLLFDQMRTRELRQRNYCIPKDT